MLDFECNVCLLEYLIYYILKFSWTQNVEDSIEQFCGDGRRLGVYVIYDIFEPFTTDCNIFMLGVIPLTKPSCGSSYLGASHFEIWNFSYRCWIKRVGRLLHICSLAVTCMRLPQYSCAMVDNLPQILSIDVSAL